MRDPHTEVIDTHLEQEDLFMSTDKVVDPVPQVEEAKPILIDTIYPSLCAPFPTKAIHWRVGATNKDKTKGVALAYLDARDVMGRLDQVVGWENWEDTYRMVGEAYYCSISINLNGRKIVKEGSAGESDIEAIKGAESGSFKRAAVKFGIGRYLYYLDAPWVAIEPAGRSYKLAQAPTLPRWAIPKDER